MSDAVLVERKAHVAIITLNRPERRNAMTAELLDSFGTSVAQLAADREVRALVISGSGRAFCAGADLTALNELGDRAGAKGAMAQQQGIRALYDAFLAVNRVDVPTVAAINGHAVGGGLGLALLCDIRIVNAQAKLGANFSRLGIHPGLGITGLLVDAVGYETAAELLFTGELIKGQEAARIGLCRAAVSADEVLERALEVASRIAAAAPLAVRQIKRTLRQRRMKNLESLLELESFAQAQLSRTADAVEGIGALLAKREPKFKGE